MNYYIEKIIASGKNKEDSVVAFTPGLNLITGPSNTGKSCIIRCVDYVSGSERLPFAEKTGYNTVKVIVKTSKGRVQFERALGENKIRVDSSDSRIESGNYNARQGKKFVSQVWLALMGIEEDHQIIANEDFKQQKLTWRTFLHTFMIDEREIDREESIIMPKGGTRNAQGKTAFLSSLLFLIYGTDYSEMSEKESKQARKIRKAALETYINSKLSDAANRKSVILQNIGQLDRTDVQREIDNLVSALKISESDIHDATRRSQSLLSEILKNEERLAEFQLLKSRYRTLRGQYVADIKRLSFITDSEDALQGVTRPDKCPFCDNDIPKVKRVSYLPAAQSEMERIMAQMTGLEESERGVERQISELVAVIRDLRQEKEQMETLIDFELKPKAKEIENSLDSYRVYIQFQNELEIIDRLADGWTTDLRDMQNEEESELKYKPIELFKDTFWKAMDGTLMRILKTCKYTPLVSAHLSKDSFDIEVNGAAKALNQGKGYCAFFNTILAMAFRSFMYSPEAVYSLPFFVVDTPLLGLDEGSNNDTPESLQKALFQYFIDSQEEGQMIVIENKRTVPELDYEVAGINRIEFTRDIKHGRYGFLNGVYFETPIQQID